MSFTLKRYSHKKSMCGGALDVDCQQSQIECVENIVWQHNAPIGQYSVFVNNYSSSNSTNHSERNKDFDVGITVGENHEMFTASMSPEKERKMKIAMFNYAKQGNGMGGIQMVWRLGGSQ